MPFWGNLKSDTTSEIKIDEEAKKFYTKGLIQPIEITNDAISQLHMTEKAFKKHIKAYSNCKTFSIHFGPGMFKRIISNNCFNVTDVASMPSMFKFIITPTISTKIAGESFFLRMDRVWAPGKQCWRAYDVNFTLVDLDDNNKTISSTQTTFPLMKFNVDNAYKNVAVKIQYKRLSLNPVTCDTAHCGVDGQECRKVKKREWKEGLNDIVNWNWENVSDYTLIENSTEQCYQLTPEVVTEYSLDNFAIRPDTFNISFTKSPVKVRENVPMELNVTNIWIL
jgi:hypothetical protein